jgi:nucleoside-diphosphate-sugar epimerase
MKAIVTGASGFIGTHLVEALTRAGYEVTCLDRRAISADSPSVQRIVADFARSDLGIDGRIFAQAAVVFHVAGMTRARSRDEFDAVNVGNTERLMDCVTRAGGNPRFVHVSSQAAAGPAMDASTPKRESDPPAPIEDYGRSKLEAERRVQARQGLDTTIVRPVAVYGPRDRDFLTGFRMAIRGLAIHPGVKNAALNTIFVKDLVRGMIAAAESPVAVGRTYFLGDDSGSTWKTVFDTMAAVAGQGSVRHVNVPRPIVRLAAKVGDLAGALAGKPFLLNSSKATLGAPRYWLCSSARARADFGFSATTSLEDGIRATHAWYVEHGWL